MDIKTTGMTSRERVLAAARGQPVDCVPVMYWLNPHAACRLMAEFQPGRNRLASWIGRTLWRRFIVDDLSDTAALRKFRQAHPDGCLLAEVAGVQQALSDIMWRTDQFMLALYDHPAEIAAFQERLADWIIGLIRNAVAADADIIFIGNDYGYTGRPLISMEMWREFTYPQRKRLIAAVHEAGALAMLHSCGYQMCFLEHYVEAGLDILQSFQPLARNDFAAAYARYGDRLAFATGIDVQQGEWMTPAELRGDILRNCRIGCSKGRFILSTTHMLLYTMPPKNVAALFETVREIQAGLHD